MPGLHAAGAGSGLEQAGFAPFAPDACLINRYLRGRRWRDEAGGASSSSTVELGLPAVFLWGGATRRARIARAAAPWRRGGLGRRGQAALSRRAPRGAGRAPGHGRVPHQPHAAQGALKSPPTMDDTSSTYIWRWCSCTESMHTSLPSRLQRGCRSQRFPWTGRAWRRSCPGCGARRSTCRTGTSARASCRRDRCR